MHAAAALDELVTGATAVAMPIPDKNKTTVKCSSTLVGSFGILWEVLGFADRLSDEANIQNQEGQPYPIGRSAASRGPFSGCGGLSLGFGKEGFQIVASLELDPLAAASHYDRHRNSMRGGILVTGFHPPEDLKVTIGERADGLVAHAAIQLKQALIRSALA
jgi:hypothetical protein